MTATGPWPPPEPPEVPPEDPLDVPPLPETSMPWVVVAVVPSPAVTVSVTR